VRLESVDKNVSVVVAQRNAVSSFESDSRASTVEGMNRPVCSIADDIAENSMLAIDVGRCPRDSCGV